MTTQDLLPCPCCHQPPLDVFGLIVCQNEKCFMRHNEMPTDEWNALTRAKSPRELWLEDIIRRWIAGEGMEAGKERGEMIDSARFDAHRIVDPEWGMP